MALFRGGLRTLHHLIQAARSTGMASGLTLGFAGALAIHPPYACTVVEGVTVKVTRVVAMAADVDIGLLKCFVSSLPLNRLSKSA